MECFSCNYSMKIEYANLKLGSIKSGPRLFSEIEGDLTILINDQIFFSESAILLLEFSKMLNDWLSNPHENFNYYSMDYEEGPILMFKKIDLKKWEISSIWSVINETKHIDSKILFDSCKNFIDKLILFLRNKIDIDDIFNNRII